MTNNTLRIKFSLLQDQIRRLTETVEDLKEEIKRREEKGNEEGEATM